MLNRRNFFKTSILAGTTTLIGTKTNANKTCNYPASTGFIEDEIPAQKGKCVMNLQCKPLKTVRIGMIALRRGSVHLKSLCHIEGVEIVAICDLFQERVDECQKMLTESGHKKADEYTNEEDWKKICERDDIDLIYNTTPWNLHVPIALYAMDHDKHVVIEVPAALTVKDCWALVDKAEEKQLHCMILENCCYDFFEMATLNMARKGEFGEILHTEGAYIHTLTGEKFNGYYKHWRLEYSKYHTGNPYPTHGLGPVAQVMGINRGDRMEYLTSMSTNQLGMSLWAKEYLKNDERITLSERYALGDMNNTLIHTVKGKTILIQHNTTNPQPYSRIHLIQGTKGLAVKYPEEKIAIQSHQFMKEEQQKVYLKKFEHPLWNYMGKNAKLYGGHGGMDYLMIWRLIYCLRNGYPLDISVYDTAVWSSIVELSERSVLNGSCAVRIPDFTREAWRDFKPLPVIDMENILHV